MQQNVRSIKRHERLEQIGMTERIFQGRRKAVWITRYACEICDTQWHHIDDPGNPDAGWSVIRTPPYTGQSPQETTA